MAESTSAGKLNLLQSVRKFQHILGVNTPRSDQRTPYNGRNLFIQFCVVQMFLSATAFFLFKAQSMYEYGLTLYASLTEVLTFVCMTTTLWKTKEIYTLIGNMENFIAKSKYTDFRVVDQYKKLIFFHENPHNRMVE